MTMIFLQNMLSDQIDKDRPKCCNNGLKDEKRLRSGMNKVKKRKRRKNNIVMDCHALNLFRTIRVCQFKKSAPITVYYRLIGIKNCLVHNSQIKIRRIESSVTEDSKVGEINNINEY